MGITWWSLPDHFRISWTDTGVIQEVLEYTLEEIIDVHDRYQDFAALSQKQAKDFIRASFRYK